MLITLCQANGDQTRFNSIRDELISMGYPIATYERMQQISCSSDPLEIGSERMGRIENAAKNTESDLIFFDNEFPEHDAYRNPNPSDRIAVRDHLMQHAHALGKRAGFWGEPSVWAHSREPISSVSIMNVLRHRHRPDHVIGNGYLRQQIVSPLDDLQYATNLAYWAQITHASMNSDQTRSPVRVFMAMQQFIRPAGTQHRLALTAHEAYALGRALACLPCSVLWWFELEYGGDDQKTLREAERNAGPFLRGWNSIGIYRMPTDAGNPQRKGD